MRRHADLTGQRFGRLVAKRPLQQRSASGNVLWLCECDCGNEHIANAGKLKAGRTKSCGCARLVKRNEYTLIGHRFNKLLVIDEVEPNQPGKRLWLCKCDCGNTCVLDTAHLRKGQKSCGCAKIEASRQMGRSNVLDLAGSRFGMLLVLSRADGTTKSHNAHWLCKCDCGNEVVVPSNYLTCANMSSCGCSHGYKMDRKQKYEEITGDTVPNGHKVIFLDGDITNWNKENLYHISHAVYTKMHKRQWFSEDTECTLAAIKVCELESAIKVKEQSL